MTIWVVSVVVMLSYIFTMSKFVCVVQRPWIVDVSPAALYVFVMCMFFIATSPVVSDMYTPAELVGV